MPYVVRRGSYKRGPKVFRRRYRGGRLGRYHRSWASRRSLVGFATSGPGEKKYVAIDDAPTMGNAGGVKCFNLMQQGTGASNRLGNKITVTDIYVDCFVYANASTGLDLARFTLVIDRQCNGANMSLSDLYLVSGSGKAVYSPFNPDKYGTRFAVVRDKTVILSPSSGNPKFAYRWQWKIKCNMVVQYNANTGNISDVVRNAICFFFSSYDNVNLCGFKYQALLKYRDF